MAKAKNEQSMTDRPPALKLADLIEFGFALSATWTTDAGGRLHLSGDIPRKPGVYLFVVGDVVHYVGVASKTLHQRMGSYVRGLRRATRKRPVHDGIEKFMREGEAVDLFTYSVEPRWGEWNGLPIDPLLGLESGLIEALNPCWNPFNLTGRTKRALLALQATG
jgi:hypothetical protein